jgi:hypothetical protein
LETLKNSELNPSKVIRRRFDTSAEGSGLGLRESSAIGFAEEVDRIYQVSITPLLVL